MQQVLGILKPLTDKNRMLYTTECCQSHWSFLGLDERNNNRAAILFDLKDYEFEFTFVCIQNSLLFVEYYEKNLTL